MKRLQSILMATIMIVTVMSLLCVPVLADGNLITNGDFESTDGWTISETHVISEEAGKTGNGLMIDYEAAGSTVSFTEINGLEVGKSYNLSFDVKVLTAIKGNGLRYIMREGASGALVGGITRFVTGEASDWTTVSASFKVSEFATERLPQLQFYFMSPTAAGKVCIDNVSVIEKALPPAKTGNIVENHDFENTESNVWGLLNSAEIISYDETVADDSTTTDPEEGNTSGADDTTSTEPEEGGDTSGSDDAATGTDPDGSDTSGEVVTQNKVLKLEFIDGQPWAYQTMTGFKPNTKYYISYNVKSDSTNPVVSTGSEGGLRSRIDAGTRASGIDMAYYPIYAVPSADNWLRVGTEFTTKSTITTETSYVLGIYLQNCTGVAYVDDIVIEEMKTDSANLAKNGSFESVHNHTGYPTNWVFTGGGEKPGVTIHMDDTDPYDGSWCLKLDCTTNKEINPDYEAFKERLAVQQTFTFEAGKTYRFSYAGKATDTNVRMVMRLTNASGVSPTFLNKGATLPEANKWYEVVTYYRPETSGSAALFIGTYNAHDGDILYIDDFKLIEVAQPVADIVNTSIVSCDDSKITEMRVIEAPAAGGQTMAYAALPGGYGSENLKGTLILATYAQKDGALYLKKVDVCSDVFPVAHAELEEGALPGNSVALVESDIITLSEDVCLVKAYMWDPSGITPLGEFKSAVPVAATVEGEQE